MTPVKDVTTEEALADFIYCTRSYEEAAEKAKQLWPYLKGYNGCREVAIRALSFLAENERPIGGEQDFNSAHCHQLTEELRRGIL